MTPNMYTPSRNQTGGNAMSAKRCPMARSPSHKLPAKTSKVAKVEMGMMALPSRPVATSKS